MTSLLRTLPLALLLVACAAEESSLTQEHVALESDSPAREDAVPKAAPEQPITSGGAPATAPAESAVAGEALPVGYYECYFTGSYGLQNSSMVSMEILSGTRYRAMEEEGDYRYDEATNDVRFTTGTLKDRLAHPKESSGKPALVFIRKENEVGGKPTLDISDTWCYLEPR